MTDDTQPTKFCTMLNHLHSLIPRLGQRLALAGLFLSAVSVTAPVWMIVSLHAGEARTAKAAALSAEDQALLTRASGYLNDMQTLEARFAQIAPDGSLSEGAFSLQRPGKMRFEYKDPTPLLVIADGTWVVVFDKSTNSTDRYPLGSTPLDIILAPHVDLAKDLMITRVERRGGIARITGRDSDEPGKGEVTLVFDEQPMALRQWVVTDAQGLVTTISLDDLRLNVPVDSRQFIFNEPKSRRRDR